MCQQSKKAKRNINIGKCVRSGKGMKHYKKVIEKKLMFSHRSSKQYVKYISIKTFVVKTYFSQNETLGPGVCPHYN